MAKILIHHHAIAHQDKNGIKLNSFIAKWVIELSKYFEKVGLLLHESSNVSPHQDILIDNNNIKLESLGAPGYKWDRFSRIRRIKNKCKSLSNKYDHLLIRGMTPRQITIWDNIKIKNRWFFLVQSIRYKYQPYNIKHFYLAMLERHRLRELKKICQNSNLISNSHESLREAKELLSKNGYFVPTNTISKNEIPGYHFRELKNPINLLFVGRIEKQKGVSELIGAIKILHDKNISCRLKLVGSINKDYRKELQYEISKMEINDLIEFHGFVKFGKRLFELYLKSDIYILPTYNEGFPHTIWEAAIHSCPILTTNVGGIPRLLDNNKHAIIFSPRSSNEISASITKIINKDDLRKNITSNAYKLACNYSVENCVRILAARIKNKNV